MIHNSSSVIAGLVLVLSTAGCFAPHFDPDDIQCKVDYDCPSDYRCTRVGTCFPKGEAPARCPDFALLCDDFEGRLTPAWGAPVTGGSVAAPAGASLAVDDAFAFRGSADFQGTRALHAVAPGAGDGSYYALAWPFMLPRPLVASETPATLAVRGYVYAAEKLQGQPFFFYAHSGGHGDGINVGVLNIGPEGASNWNLYNRLANSRTLVDSTAPIDVGRWYCVELVMTVQTSSGTLSNAVDLYVDGAALGHRVVTGVEASNPIDEVDVGITWSEGSASNEFALDDVVIADRRIGCE